MYICTLAPKYTLIGPARASLSAFAVQTNEKKLVKEARNTTGSGLRTMSKKRGQHKIEWADVGASTVQKFEVIIKKYQRLTWRLINRELGVIESSLECVGRVLVLGECHTLSLVEKIDFELSKTLEGSIVR